ncbi:hypothetical protein SRDD_26550 [Serratia sp. DD3]|nr:hypothetical protein SRDD_26550 [Serratia sp. DD3]
MQYRFEYGEIEGETYLVLVNHGQEWYSSESLCRMEIDSTIRSICDAGQGTNIWWKIYNENGNVVQQGNKQC